MQERPVYDITTVPVVTSTRALCGGIKEVLRDVGRVFSECLERKRLIKITVAGMQKTVLTVVKA